MVTCVIAPEEETKLRQRPPLVRKLFGFPALLAVLFALVVFLAIPKKIADPDIGWHLRNAQIQLQTRAFLHRDLYSFTTTGKPWMDHEWLAEIPFYLAWRALGPRGIYLVTVVAIEIILLGILGLACLESGSIKAAFVVCFAAMFLASVSFGPRTLLFGWMFLVLELGLLAEFRRGRDFLWALPFVFLLWINAHGSWIIGLVVLAVVAISGCVEGTWGSIEATRWTRPQAHKLAWVSLLSTLALFVNPYGWRLTLYPFDLAFHQKLNIASVDEWRSLDFHSPRGKIVLAIMAGAILLQLVRRRRWRLDEVLLLLIGTYAALTYSRFLFLAAILIVPLMAKGLASAMPYYADRDKPCLNAAIMLGALITVVLLFPSNQQLIDRGSTIYPDAAAQKYLQNFHPRGNVFNDYLWGGYLIWNVRQVPVFIDSRMDVFERNGVLADYLHAIRIEDSLQILDKYSIQYVLFENHRPMTYLLRHTPGWKVDFQDKSTILFERTRPLAQVNK
ncbi:MAG TPA: hypothetical protein VMF56_16535 [Acidobacteriaceae bacterium]|nr:hypothetical protein [Acidobacteriaceae bacterium]